MMYNNYYNTNIFKQFNDSNSLTLLPYSAYMEYEHQFKQTFAETTNLKKSLNNIIYASIDSDTDTDTTANANSDNSVESELLSSIESSLNPSPAQSDSEQLSVASSPLPTNTDDSNTDEPNELLTAIDKLRNIADTRDDIDDFILYLSERYNIDLNEPIDDLPFEVIDEIMTYIDYDPDNDIDIFDQFDSSIDSDVDDQIIIPPERLDEFRSLLSQFTDHVNALSRLYKINGITDSRYDEAYNRFQYLFKPTVEPLIRLYKHTIRDYDEILTDSVKTHQDQLTSTIDFDFEYDDYDY